MGTATQLDQGLKDAEAISAKLDALPGSLGMFYLVDRANGKALAVTLWDSEDALIASEAAAGEMRRESSQAEGTAVLSVGRFEVAANTTPMSAAAR